MTIVCVKQRYTQFPPPHTHTHNIHKKIKCTLFFCLLNPQLLQLLTEWECCEQSDCVTPAANHFFHFPQNWYWLNVDSGHVFHNFWPGKSADYLYQNVPDEQYELKRRYVVSRSNVKKYFADAALTLKSDDQGEQPASSDCRVSARFWGSK